MFRRLTAAATLAALAAAAPAAATTFTLEKAGSNVHGIYGSRNMTISPGGGASTGAFDVKLKAGDSHGVKHLADRFAAFCLDIATALKLPSQYTVTATPFAHQALTAGQKNDIKALFETGYDAALLGGNTYSAAFQLALWEIVNETAGSYDLTAGAFTATGNAGTLTAANTLLAGLGGPVLNRWRVVYLQSLDGPDADSKRDSQNLVTVAAVPLPAAGVLLLAALGGMGALRRRKAAA